MNKKSILFFLLIPVLLAGCASRLPPDTGVKEQTLVILHTNDFHGHPLKFDNYPASDVAGLPAIATFVKKTRDTYENVLIMDAGDINTGRPESNFFKAEPDIIGYNYIGYDVMALGNHEFDNPREILFQQMELADFPFISANVLTAEGTPLTTPFIIKEYAGFKAGIFGLTTTETEVIGSPEFIDDLTFADEVETAENIVTTLEELGVDVIIALVHMGLYSDPSLGSKNLAAHVDGIDLIIDGHSHSQITEPVFVNGTPIVQAYNWGMYMGKGIMKIQSGEITSFVWEPVPINLKNKITLEDGSTDFEYIGEMYPEDPELLSKLQIYADKVEMVLSETIGTAENHFPNADVRGRETALGDLVADSMLWFAGNLNPDFAIQNGGGIRADLPAGEIKKKNIYEILPFDNSVYVLKLTGAQVQELFHYISSIPQGKGSFPQVSSGVQYTINYNTGRCEDIMIGGKPLNLSEEYTIVTNSFMAAGGDGYKIFTEASYTYDTSTFQRDAFIEYIIEIGGTISPEIKNRIRITGSREV